MDERDREVVSLRAQLEARERARLDEDAVEREVMAQYPDFSRAVLTSRRRVEALEIGLLVESPRSLREADRERLIAWLQVRTGAKAVWVDVRPAAPAAATSPNPGSPRH